MTAKSVFNVLFSCSWYFKVEGVQCYVCSWSPADSSKSHLNRLFIPFSHQQKNNNSLMNIQWFSCLDRADVCTSKNFSESVRTHSCETGCETVTVYDKNGKVTTRFDVHIRLFSRTTKIHLTRTHEIFLHKQSNVWFSLWHICISIFFSLVLLVTLIYTVLYWQVG